MSEGGEDEPHEVSVEIRDEFQRQVIEYIKETRNEFQIVNGQISMLAEELKNMKNNTQEMIQKSMKVKKDKVEEEILSQGFSSYSFTPFEKDKKGGGGKMSSFTSQSDEDDRQVSNKKLDNDEDDSDDSDDSDEDEEKDDKNMGKKDVRKSFMREANQAGTLTKGFQQVIVQPPSFSLMLKNVSKDPDSVKFTKHFINKFNHHHKSTPMGHQTPKIARNIIDPVLQVLLNWYMANKAYFDRYLPELQTDTLEEFAESDNDCVIKIITNFVRPTTPVDQMLLFKSIDPIWGSLDSTNLTMETFIEQYNIITRYISDLESMYRFIFDFDLRRDVNVKTRKVFAEIMKRSMPHFERDHSKPSFWKIVTAKIPGPLRKMIFEEAKKEAEGKVKMTQMKVFSEGDSTISVMDIAKRKLVESLKLFNGEISRFSKNYDIDKLLDPNAKLTNIQECLGSPQLEEIAKELGDDFQAFHSLLKNVE